MAIQMNRSKRALTEEEARGILQRGDWGIMACVGADGQPYGVPINYVYANNSIILHCAPEVGLKLDNIRYEPRVTFTVVENHEVLQDKISCDFSSAIVFGRARIVEDLNEKNALLTALVERLCPDCPEVGMKCIESSGDKTGVIEITIDEVTGKARR